MARRDLAAYRTHCSKHTAGEHSTARSDGDFPIGQIGLHPDRIHRPDLRRQPTLGRSLNSSYSTYSNSHTPTIYFLGPQHHNGRHPQRHVDALPDSNNLLARQSRPCPFRRRSCHGSGCSPAVGGRDLRCCAIPISVLESGRRDREMPAAICAPLTWLNGAGAPNGKLTLHLASSIADRLGFRNDLPLWIECLEFNSFHTSLRISLPP
jgi:hypothetical protein